MRYLAILFLFSYHQSFEETEADVQLQTERLQRKSALAFEYCKQHRLNKNFCVLIDMSRHSGLPRLYVWDFEKDTIAFSGLCSHGCCDMIWGSDQSKEKPVFSNVPDSHCSALGKYRIGGRGYSQWGINVNYQLHGLDSTNNNAHAREIVLHSWDVVSETTVYPNGTPEGWGCPAVSNETMRFLDAQLKNRKRVLLWMFR